LASGFVSSPPSKKSAKGEVVTPASGCQPTQVCYPTFRRRALEARRIAHPGGGSSQEMKALYSFWLHFLPQHFNARMYHDFRTYAMQDAQGCRPVKHGLRKLMEYYEEVLLGGKENSSGLGQPAVANLLAQHHAEARRLAFSSQPLSKERLERSSLQHIVTRRTLPKPQG
jgi:hypothetical protein